MFIGEYSHNVDTKGRMIMPSKFRTDEPGEIFYITKDVEGCLAVYTPEEWSRIEQKTAALPINTNPQAAAFARFLLSGAAECEVDKLGRINIPSHLRDYAGITKDVKVLGIRSRIEVWDLERWESYQANTITPQGIREIMGSIGLEF